MSGRNSSWLTTAIMAAICALGPHSVSAQTMKYSCPQFFSGFPHQTLDCIEAVFSESPVHATVSSVPPSNGLALGIVAESEVHHVSPFAPTPDPSITSSTQPPVEGVKSLTDLTLALVGSTNQSWYVTGAFAWLPPLRYQDSRRNSVSCHKLGPLCTQQVFGIQFYGTHRSIKSLAFYGEGSRSPATEYDYQESETYGGAIARLPLTNWLSVSGQIEDRQPALGFTGDATAVNRHFSEATAPGLQNQPDFLHYGVSAGTDARYISEGKAMAAPAGGQTPLMRHKFAYRFQNSVSYAWYRDMGAGRYTFSQFVFRGDESVALGGVVERFVAPNSSAAKFLRIACLGDAHKAQDICDLGKLDVKTLLVASRTGAGAAVPFYYQPTLGGGDIDSQVSLRGYDNYRFRGRDAALVQVEYSRTISFTDPLGPFIFYDAGTVGSALNQLSVRNFRQDGGVGLFVRLLGKVVLQAYMAEGAGHGIHFGYNFEKLF